MSATRTVTQILDQEFLVLRAKLLELGAGLDRLSRAAGNPAADARFAQLQAGIQQLQADCDNHAEQLQLIFSLPYDPHWKQRFELKTTVTT
jgi:hypothetical protein